jgi:alpha-glucosidase
MGGERDWWHGALGYEIYLRSFQDTDGDGVGDLAGVRARLDHLERLGVDVVWVTPFYPSPMHDHGYDVADYTDVDPTYGTMDDVDALIADAHGRGIRVLVDIVPNHTSDQHRWFQSALTSREAPERDMYIWRDPAPDGGPPNNWVSVFGGPAWSYHEPTGQYWLHLFLPEQPDLNWSDPKVADEFDRILRFWLERGVDGFRIDVAHGLVKDEDLRDNPVPEDLPADAGPMATFHAHEHVHDLDQVGVLDVYRRWRKLVEPYGAVLVGEVYLLDPQEAARYIRDDDGLHLALAVPTARTTWDADAIRNALRDATTAGRARFAWTPSSHDDARAPTRFGGGPQGRERALTYLALLAGLPGLLMLYMGDELGLEDGDVPPDRRQDPVAVRAGAAGRDGSRTPMPWEAGEGMGFTTGEPWLPLGRRSGDVTVTAQAADPDSFLHRARDLLALRRDLASGAERQVRWLTDDGDPVVAYRRGSVLVAANCGDESASLPLPAGSWGTAFSTGVASAAEGEVRIAADAAVILREDPA